MKQSPENQQGKVIKAGKGRACKGYDLLNFGGIFTMARLDQSIRLAEGGRETQADGEFYGPEAGPLVVPIMLFEIAREYISWGELLCFLLESSL